MTARLEIERRLTLPIEDCFALWTDPRNLREWWGPKDQSGEPFRSEIVQWDVREGATWAIDMIAPDGTVYRQRGEMIEVVPPTLIRFSFHWEENGERGPRTEISVRLDPDGDGTKLRFEHTGLADAKARDGHAQGWKECLDRLEDAANRRSDTAA